MHNVRPDDHEATPRAVVAIGNDYPPAFELARHSHRRAQLLYAAEGVVTVDTDQGAWVAPPERAVWIPAGVAHAVKMVGAVSTRSVLIEPEVCVGRGGQCQVLAVSALLRSLLLEAADVPAEYDADGRDGALMALLIAEVARAPVIPLAVPFPKSPALARQCAAFLARPNAQATIDDWSEALHLGRRAFTRGFRRETGLSFAAWRQQACLLAALPRLAAGDPVTAIALDLGYDSPAAFSTMFKRLLGMPPSRYRR
jgi:AraC-like DNA-binding protein/mannose-6-phosphate isomerase-like protein (cupin superfamily)